MSNYRKFHELGETKNTSIDYQIMELQNREHKNDIIKKTPLVCVEVYANWCQPCKQIAPEYAMLAKQYKGRCDFVREDYSNLDKRQFPIQSVPTFLLFQGGRFLPNKVVVGADLEKVRKYVDELLEEMGQFRGLSNPPPLGHAPQGSDALYRRNYGQQPHPNAYPSAYPNMDESYAKSPPPDMNGSYTRSQPPSQAQPQIRYQFHDH